MSQVFPVDRPDEQIPFIPGTVIDSEGNALDPQPALNVVFESTDTNVVSFTQDAGDPNLLNLHYGSPGTTTLRATVSTEDGGLHEVIEETIRLVPGAAAGISAGRFGFPEQPAPPQPEPEPAPEPAPEPEPEPDQPE